MIKHVKMSICALALALSVSGHAHAQDDPSRHIMIVIENGGVVPQAQREEALRLTFALLGEVTELRKRRATRETQVSIILTANPSAVAWTGDVSQLYAQSGLVIEMVAFRDTCSDLELAYDEVRLSAQIDRPDHLEIIHVGPFIHAGFPCTGENARITLPQAVPQNLALAHMAQRSDAIRFIGVHADQDEPLLAYLEATGVLDRVEAGALSFDLLDAARARSRAGHLLGDR
ncbi:MAG: hypothetical protein AAGF57_13295 [Pseudomonadota bacterium]